MRHLLRVLIPLILFISVNNIHCINARDGKAYHDKGKIVDTVRCSANSKYSYALYLPTNYSEDAKWPIIYIFDPGAKGKLALSGFVPAAEKYGYIAVCSNNSRNSLSGAELEEAINYLFNDTEDKFSIDPRRVYTSGFSGGSRVASLVALNSKFISGVIGCGAGFPNSADFKNITSFDYFGLVGNRDMNYLEMYDLEKKLDNLGMSVELRIFNGGHTWPSPDLLEEAIEWMELKAMYKGIKNKNPDLINTLFGKYNKKAVSLSEQGKLLESVYYYKDIIKDFPDHIGITKIKSKRDSLLLTKDYVKSLKTWDKNRSWELEIQSTLVEDFNVRVKTEELSDSIRIWWTSQIKMLKVMETSKDSSKQAIASRVLMLLNIMCYETGRNYSGLKRFKAAAICYQLASIVDPENKNNYFLLARIYSLNGETDEALRSLEKAIKAGYNNRQSIEKDSAFIPLKNEKRFRSVMMQLK
jgi:tetratricopeptide (TPR) repeat protein